MDHSFRTTSSAVHRSLNRIYGNTRHAAPGPVDFSFAGIGARLRQISTSILPDWGTTRPAPRNRSRRTRRVDRDRAPAFKSAI